MKFVRFQRRSLDTLKNLRLLTQLPYGRQIMRRGAGGGVDLVRENFGRQSVRRGEGGSDGR
jgi:hypothetical protein